MEWRAVRLIRNGWRGRAGDVTTVPAAVAEIMVCDGAAELIVSETAKAKPTQDARSC